MIGGEFYIDASWGGFSQTGDSVVRFVSNNNTGMVWYIRYNSAGKQVTIPADWGPSLKIFTRHEGQGAWTELTAGQAY